MKPIFYIFVAIFPLILDANAETSAPAASASPIPSGKHVCKTNVSYTWKRSKEAVEEEEVFVKKLEAEGADPEETNKNLEALLAKAKSEAVDICRGSRENISGCIAGKYTSLAPIFQQMEFSSRKKLLDAIDTDCKAVTGICGAAKSSTPQCEVKKGPELGQESSAPAKEEKKGAKKK